MIRVGLGEYWRDIPETIEEELAQRPEAMLRALFAGDVDGMQRYHDRVRDLELRFDRWLAGA